MSGSPIKYTSRTFLTALADINSDPLLVDKPDWFKRLIAGMVDVSSMLVNAEANNGYLRTALTRRAVYDLCALIDYNPTPQSTASGTLFFDAKPDAVMPFTVDGADLAGNGPSSYGQSTLRYGARSSLTFNSLTESVIQSSGIDTGTGAILVSGSYTTGEKVRLVSSGTMPTGLSINTDYFAIQVDAMHVKLASTRALAFAGTPVIPSAVGSGNMTITRLSRSVAAYQQNDVASYVVGQSDGVTPFQEFDIMQAGVIPETVAVSVNGVSYSLVSTLALSGPTDRVFRLFYNTDGTCTLRFGSGSYGAVPPAAPVYVSYSYGGGTISNVSNLNVVTAYAGGDANLNGCFNSTIMSGGGDAETLESAKKNAPMLLKARSRFVTVEDGVALALAYGGLAVVTINRNVYGVLSCQVVGVANGGGDPSPSLRTAIADYLISLSPLGDVYVQFDSGTFTAPTFSANVHLMSGYSWSTTLPYLDLAVRLFFSDCGAEILSSYLSGGISAATAKINTLFSKSFTGSDYATITKLLDQLQVVGVRSFGDLIQESDFYALITAIPGVDYAQIVSWSPSTGGQYYQCAAAEITQVRTATITLTQV